MPCHDLASACATIAGRAGPEGAPLLVHSCCISHTENDAASVASNIRAEGSYKWIVRELLLVDRTTVPSHWVPTLCNVLYACAMSHSCISALEAHKPVPLLHPICPGGSIHLTATLRHYLQERRASLTAEFRQKEIQFASAVREAADAESLVQQMRQAMMEKDAELVRGKEAADGARTLGGAL